ncbi:MAG: YdcF family protein [Clostridia bacterium]|nr:YdcF family protein [Clostridia bacterium]
MKLSELTREDIASMPFEAKVDFICGSIVDEGKSAPVAILLGGNPNNARPRALAAAELYKSGRAPFIMPSGGVKWEVDGEMISESHYMKRILMENGVPEEAIILENQATTTKENMIFATLQINRKLHFEKIDSVIVVTSRSHMKRSIALAKAFLPRKVTVSAYPANHEAVVAGMPESEGKWIAKELDLIKSLVDGGLVEDMEI